MRIGTMFIGEVDKVGGQCVRTKFLVIGVPLLPLGSTFVVSSDRGIDIGLHGKSVLFGYLRTFTWVVAVILGIKLLMRSSYLRQPSDYVPVAVAVAIAIGSLALGRLSAAEKVRRRVLLRATGFGADPRILPRDVRLSIASELWGKLAQHGLACPPEEWIARATTPADPYRGRPSLEHEAWADAYALACHAAVEDAAWRGAVAPLWKRVTETAGAGHAAAPAMQHAA